MGQIGDNVGKGDNTFFISCIANNIFFLSKHLMYAFRINLVKMNIEYSQITKGQVVGLGICIYSTFVTFPTPKPFSKGIVLTDTPTSSFQKLCLLKNTKCFQSF